MRVLGKIMITITIQGLDKLVDRFPKYTEKLKDELDGALKTSIMIVEAESKKNAPKDTGKLMRSHKVEFGYLKASLIPMAEYAECVHEGTRPHFPPIEPIENWARRKLGKTGLGYVIARKIAQKGTKPNPFLRKAAENKKREVVAIFVEAVKRVVKL